jgi:predicted dehydrogenase
MDTVRWGVLSTAAIGTEKVIPAIQRAEGCEVVAIASRDGERAAAAAGALDIGRSYGTYEALLEDPEIDAVYNPLPNHLHHPWSVAATRAGKPVLCEKPLGRTRAEAQAIVDDCAPDVLLMEAFMYRFHPSWQAARRLAAESIGGLEAVHTRFSYFNDDPTNIRNRPECGGGALLDIGCYAVNLSRMLFGSEPTGVEAAVEVDPEVGVDVLSSALLRFPTGHATFTCSTRGEPDQRVTLLGRDGRVEIEIPFNIPPDRPTRVLHTAGGDPPTDPDTETLTFAPADPYTLQAEAFAAALRSGDPAPLDPADAVDNLAVLDAIRARGTAGEIA